MATYQTISSNSEALFKDRGSRFIGIAMPAQSEEEVNELLTNCRKQYYDATHHCYAYRIGIQTISYRANDDGEPNHSAGDPILGKIKSLDLTNTLVIVVRYYGGTKLGVGGLINAYRTAAELALETATIETVEITVTIKITYPYDNTSEILRQVDQCEIKITDQQFMADCTLIGEIAEEKIDVLLDNLKLLTEVKIIRI
jgi:uncharacterized YigZ family protein